MKPTKLLDVLFAFLAAHSAGAAILTVTNTADNGPGTLRQALATAEDGDSINFSLPFPSTIRLTGGELLVTHSVEIGGPGADSLLVDGAGASRIFHVAGNNTVGISGLTLTNGYATGLFPDLEGGGIYNDQAALTVNYCVVTRNRAGLGGGIYNNAGTVSLSHCAVVGNGSSARGGGIVNANEQGKATLILNACSVMNNGATEGGGIYIYDNDESLSFSATVIISTSRISGNTCVKEGGGINNYNIYGNTTLLVNDTTFASNQAGQGGGLYGLFTSGTQFMVANSTFSNNYAFYGGGIFAFTLGADTNVGTVTVSNCTLSGNAAWTGGGIFGSTPWSSGLMRIVNSTLSGNVATNGSGGGIFTDVGTVYTDGSVAGSAMVEVLNSTFSSNSASFGGGGIHMRTTVGSGTLKLGSTILAKGSGMNLTNDGPVFSLGYNLSSDDGGGFLSNPTDLMSTDPLLGPLQDNGGPTLTHAPLPGSPAIDQGMNFAGLATDQRGFARTLDDPGVLNAPGGDGTDIGAVEAQPPSVSDTLTGLIKTIESSNLAGNRQHALTVSLNAALASVERDNWLAAANQLQAFQNKVRAQLLPSDSALAQRLIMEASAIIEALGKAR
jgi:predicted outer membrane repeat protein